MLCAGAITSHVAVHPDALAVPRGAGTVAAGTHQQPPLHGLCHGGAPVQCWVHVMQSITTLTRNSVKFADELRADGIPVTVIDVRQCYGR